MGTQNQDQNRQAQGGAGQRTFPHDPKLNPKLNPELDDKKNRERDDENQVEQRTSDEGRGRDEPGSGRRSSAGEMQTDDDLNDPADKSGKSKSGATDPGQAGANRGGNS